MRARDATYRHGVLEDSIQQAWRSISVGERAVVGRGEVMGERNEERGGPAGSEPCAGPARSSFLGASDRLKGRHPHDAIAPIKVDLASDMTRATKEERVGMRRFARGEERGETRRARWLDRSRLPPLN